MKIRIARALTKPVTTERDTKRITVASLKMPKMICSTPVSTVAASRYCSPCSRTRVTISRAMAPVAAEIMPGRPPAKAVTTAIQKEAYNPTLGSTSAMIENAMASGIRASATTMPDSTSPRTLENQFSFNGSKTESFSQKTARNGTTATPTRQTNNTQELRPEGRVRRHGRRPTGSLRVIGGWER